MKEQPIIPKLIDLRPDFGIPIKEDHKLEGWIKLRPGHSRKIYGLVFPKGRWMYRPEVVRLEERLKTVKEISKRIDDRRSLDQLVTQLNDALNQIRLQAHIGNERAANLLVSVTAKAIGSLEWLVNGQPELSGRIATEHSHWPTLLSLNTKDIPRAIQQVTDLGVGTKSLIPTHAGQKVDFENFWTHIAMRATQVCWNNKIWVPMFEQLAAGAERERVSLVFWSTPVRATMYTLPDHDVIVIADWQRRCKKLTIPIRQAHLDEWWKVVKDCVLERWWEVKSEYRLAISKISDKQAPKDYEKRKRAFDQVRQAFESLTKRP